MKKLLALVIILCVAATLAVAATAADSFDYAHIVASGNDPYGQVSFSADGAHTEIDPDTVKWAKIKYRTVTEKDSTGVQLRGQLYVVNEAEPFIPITYKHTQKWETGLIDLTAVSEKTSLTSIWDSTHYTVRNVIRFDPMEPDRDAEDQQNEHNVAEVEPDSSIDVAWIAFFENKADAEAYDGTQSTPYCIITPNELKGISGNSIKEVEIKTEDGAAPDPSGSNPSTSDASVVAIASLACIALAGVVVAFRKVR